MISVIPDLDPNPRWESNFKHPQGWTFEIEHVDPNGYYLYIFDEEGRPTHDYLQDTFEIAQDQAWEDFGIPLDSWIKETMPSA